MERLAHCIAVHGLDGIMTQIYAHGVATPGSGAWPAANDAIFVPMSLRFPAMALRMWIINGATATGNVDVGLYTMGGDRIVSIGSTAQSGTTAPQYFNITDTYLSPGNYYMAVAMDGTTGTTRRFNFAVERCQAAGIVKATTAFALPATVTFTSITAAYIPQVGVDLIGTMT